MARSYVEDGGVGAPRDKLLVVVHLCHDVIHLFHGIPATSHGHNSLHGSVSFTFILQSAEQSHTPPLPQKIHT